jgi:hypothetical protein
MRILLSTSILSLLLLFSCKKSGDNNNPPQDGNLSASRTTVRLDTAVNTYDTFTVQSDVEWKTTISSTWLQLDQSTGQAGNTVVQVKVLSNNGASTRTATIKLEAKNNDAQPVTVTVTQKPYTISLGWKKTLGGTLGEGNSGSVKSPDGGYVFAGYTGSTDGDVTGNHGNSDMWIVKLDAAGSKQWAKAFGGTSADWASSIITTSDGGYLVAGYSSSTDGDFTENKGGLDVALLKLDASGNKQWTKTYGGANTDMARFLVATADGGYVVVASTNSINGDVTGNHGSDDYWVLKVDGTGTKQWANAFGGSTEDHAYSIVLAPDGGFLVAGYSQSTNGDMTGNHGNFDMWVIKLDASGTKQWAKAFGGTGDDRAFSITPATGGGYAVTGYTRSSNGDVTDFHGIQDMWVIKINEAGEKQWAKAFGGSTLDEGTRIIATTDGGYAVAGINTSPDGDVTGNHGGADIWIVKLNATGIKQWGRSIGGLSYDAGYPIIQSSNGFILGGYTDSNDGDITGQHGMGDMWIAQVIVEE